MSKQQQTAHKSYSNISRLTSRATGKAFECRTKYRYDPFGLTNLSSGTLANVNVYRFSSKEYHAASGMYYYLYRFYAPDLQRWMNRDPIGEDGGINLYEFVANNPVTEMDSFGLQVASVPQSPVQWPPVNPFPSHPASADKDKGVQNNSGNAPVAYPVPVTTMSPCRNQGETRITKPPTLAGGSCPCSNIPIRCFSYESCEKIPVAQGLNETMWSLRWVPYTRCTRCPEY